MPRPRKTLVSIAATPYYHVFSRCVRRAYLCGTDKFSGRSYAHRRAWIEDRLRVLASVFSVEVCAYAVMSNHYHLVVKLIPNEATNWSDDEVLKRWTILFKGPLLVQSHRKGKTLDPAEKDALCAIAAVYRKRLTSLSWFMKCLNEPIARQANAEDGCTGHFWEARFQSQALMTERALVTAMAYVDLNPIRAGLATMPENSEYTSIRTRMRCTDTPATVKAAAARLLEDQEIRHAKLTPRLLAPFEDGVVDAPERRLPIRLHDYYELLDSSGRLLAQGKRGRIDSTLEPILERLKLSADEWMGAAKAFRKYYRVGDVRPRKSA